MNVENIQPQITEYLYRKACIKKIPLAGTFELSPRCNLNCKMCYVRMSKEQIQNSGYREKTADEWIELGKKCREAGMLFLLLTGGEPFLLKGFRKIYSELSKMGFIIKINTNATMITKETVEWLREMPPSRMNITVYGSSNETYERLCNNPNGFDQVSNAIDLLKEANIPIRISMTLTQHNIDDMKDIYKFAKEKEVQIRTTSYIFPPTRKDENKIGVGERMDAKEAAYYDVLGSKLGLDEDGFKRKVSSMKNLVKIREEKLKENVSNGLLPMSCRAGRCTFWINWKGEMTPCGMMNFPKSKPFEIGFENAWKGILDATNKIFLSKECSACNLKSICHVCPSVAYAETGEFEKKPTYICNMTKNIYEQILNLVLENN